MDTYNGFSKGMNQDTSKLKYSQENYLEGLNIRILTDEGLSSLAVENTKGTKTLVTVPKIGWAGTFIPSDYYNGGVADVDITFYSPTNTPLTIALGDISQLTTAQIWDKITGALGIYSDYYGVSYSENYIFIQQYSNINTVTVVEITWDTGSGTQTDSLPLIKDTSYVDNFEPFIIGWGLLKREIVLFVCDAASLSDDVSDELGQIWKFSVDEITDTATITAANNLVYNNILNFSREYAIYKEVKTRYESEVTGTVVWTDNYNVLRTLNVFDPQAAAVPPQLLAYKPRHLASLPVVTNLIAGGLLVSGSYQYFYRLRSFQGAYSTLSPQSQPIQIGRILNTNNLNTNLGGEPGQAANKSVQITISDLDTTYDYVEIGVTIYQVEGVPESFWFATEVIPNSRVVTTVHNGTETLVPIEDDGTNVEVLNNANMPPDVFKTIEVVKNRLFAANAKTFTRDLEFDARAYRFNAATNADLYNSEDSYGSPYVIINGGITVDVTIDGVGGQTLLDIPDTADLINPYNDENPSNALNGGNWEVNSQYKFQLDGTTLGGEGPNIKYKFTERSYTQDVRGQSAALPLAPLASTIDSNLPEVDPGNGFVIPTISNYEQSYNNPQVQQFVGYARGEVYRFGIVFYDLAGYPYLTKWIGDIKFPTASEGVEIEVPSGLGTASEAQPITVGIEFTLDTTTDQFKAIKDKISGWQFVRLKREEKDKTRLGTGLLSQVIADVTTGTPLFIPNNWATNDAGALTTVAMIDTPNGHFSVDWKFLPGDYIKVIGKTASFSGVSGIIDAFGIVWKFTESTYYSSPNSYDLAFMWNVARVTNAQQLVDGLLGAPFVNMTGPNASNEWAGQCEKTNLIAVNTSLATDYAALVSNFDKLIISYERYLTNQYGGNTRFDRYDNEYISTGGYYQYRGELGNTVVETWGGDVWTTYYDHQKVEANFENMTQFASPGAGLERAYWFYSAEAHGFNPMMRTGTRVANKDLLFDSSLLQSLTRNPAYDQQNTLQKFYSKPLQLPTEIFEPHSIYVTDPKIDRETTNSWRNFKSLDTLVVNGNYGEINRLIELKDRLFFYQTDAIGIAAVEERVIVPAETGQPTTLGTGEVLQRYDYITTQTGSFHQFGVEKSGQGIYHYDVYLNKIFKLGEGEGAFALSDILGMSSYFRNTFVGDILTTDKLLREDRRGVHAVFNPEYNCVLFTFLDQDASVTISYNELLQAFDSFHSFAPSMYLNTRRRLYGVKWGRDTHNEIHTIFRGVYNQYFGTYQPSYMKLLTNGQNPYDKTWDNQEFRTEVKLVNTDMQETISQARYTNDYQTSNAFGLNPGANIKRMLRTWRVQIPFDQSNPSLTIKPRFMDKFLITEWWYNNTPGAERRLVLHDVRTEYSLRAKINLPNSK